jgi:hypothetical protein
VKFLSEKFPIRIANMREIAKNTMRESAKQGFWNGTTPGFVTLADDRCDKSSIQSRSRRSSHLASRLHGRGSDCPVRLR